MLLMSRSLSRLVDGERPDTLRLPHPPPAPLSLSLSPSLPLSLFKFWGITASPPHTRTAHPQRPTPARAPGEADWCDDAKTNKQFKRLLERNRPGA